MRRTPTSERRATARRLAGVLLAGATLATCSPVEVQRVEEVRIQLQGAPDVAVHLLTSTNFRTVQQGASVEIEVGDAQTAWRALPFDTTFDIRVPRRFLVRVLETDDEEAEVEMRVWADGVQEYHHAAVVAQTPMQYVYLGR